MANEDLNAAVRAVQTAQALARAAAMAARLSEANAREILAEIILISGGLDGALVRTNNLNDLTDVPTARINLGLGTAAVLDSGDLLQAANNLSDIVDAAEARDNLGISTSIGSADWTIDVCRVYAISNATGSDLFLGYADPTTTGTAAYAIGCAAAGLVAKKTFSGLGAILPREGAGRTAEIVIEGDVSSYAGDLTTLLAGCTGYLSITVRGTGTNTTAGCTAFDGSVADCLYLGATTAPSMNSAGYKPTEGGTTTSVPCTKFDLSAAGFAAEPTVSGHGYRIRFDANTQTVALRNATSYFCKVTGSTLTLVAALAAAPAAPVAGVGGDVFYIEKAGVTWSGTAAFRGLGGGLLNLAGVGSATTLNIFNANVNSVSFCQSGTSMSFSDCVVSLNRSYAHPVHGTITASGSRSGTSLTVNRSFVAAIGITSGTSSSFAQCPFVSLGNGCVTGSGNASFSQCPAITWGSTGASPTVVARTLAGGIVLNGFCSIGCGQGEFNGQTAITILGARNFVNLGNAQGNTTLLFPYDGVTKGFFFIDLHNGGVASGVFPKDTLISIRSATPPPEGGFATIIGVQSQASSWATLISRGGGAVDNSWNYVSVDDVLLFVAQNKLATFLSDSDQTVAPGTDKASEYHMRLVTTGNRNITTATTSAVDKDVVRFVNFSSTHTLQIKDGAGTNLYLLPVVSAQAAKAVDLIFSSTQWVVQSSCWVPAQ